MKGKRPRGNWVITKIEITGFPINIDATNQHGARWWQPIRKELKNHAAALYKLALQTYHEGNRGGGVRPPLSDVPLVTPMPPDVRDEVGEQWMDPVFPCLVSSTTEPAEHLPSRTD
jgi:hypothetical protein